MDFYQSDWLQWLSPIWKSSFLVIIQLILLTWTKRMGWFSKCKTIAYLNICHLLESPCSLMNCFQYPQRTFLWNRRDLFTLKTVVISSVECKNSTIWRWKDKKRRNSCLLVCETLHKLILCLCMKFRCSLTDFETLFLDHFSWNESQKQNRQRTAQVSFHSVSDQRNVQAFPTWTFISPFSLLLALGPVLLQRLDTEIKTMLLNKT